ncbi:hypothetical protein EJ03DRAFT_375324 [Teratosphaeria nubilosa]|uniref:Uncharacterized protein n=1 Tax=Teratosphaeria nubilosa TaxID=161662 RepID=A0A6G1L7Q5_9PEZI|nr:hypothetical protein EJ03DRAFT_375324 [Teratosphaeria nubilosa]
MARKEHQRPSYPGSCICGNCWSTGQHRQNGTSFEREQGPVEARHGESNADIELPAYPSRVHEIRREHRLAVNDPDSVGPPKQVEIEAPRNPFADPRNPFADSEDPSTNLKNPFADTDPENASPALDHTGKQTQAKRFCAPSKRTILGLIFIIVLLIACIVAGVVSWKMGQNDNHRVDFECGHDITGPDCAARFRNGMLALDYQEAYSHQPGNSSTRDEYRVSIPEWLRYNCYWLSNTFEQHEVGVWKCSPKVEIDPAYHDAGEEPGAGVLMDGKAEMHLEPGSWVERCDEERVARDENYAAHCWQADQDALLPKWSEAEVEGAFECGHGLEAPSCYAYYEGTEAGESDYVQMVTTHANDLVKYFRINVPNWLRLTCQWVPAGYEQYVYGVTEGAWMCGDKYMSVLNTSTVVDGWVTRCDRDKLFSEENSHCWSVDDDNGVNSSVPIWPTWEQSEGDQPILDLEDVLHGGN